ncbi:MAG: NAD(P)/FAD-dependent oxidoreductase [Aeromicrobium sp.]
MEHDVNVHSDVIIVGAGLSGVGAAYRLQTECPDKSYTILEARDAIGGTWDLFRYPGIRSDSDMFTLSWPFRPWTHPKAIAEGSDILDYIKDAADDFGIEKNIQFGNTVQAASWSSDDALWTVTSLVDGTEVVRTASFLYFCTGVYDANKGHQPEFPGIDTFAGVVVHPQFWPEDLDYADKEVVVIGSGATAVTLIPSIADDTKHVTMLQRSPTYVISRSDGDPIANLTRKVLPAGLAHRFNRRMNAVLTIGLYQYCKRFPNSARKLIAKQVTKRLPEGYDVATHFNPTYNPWDQRLCAVPNGDLFRSIRHGKASVVTDHIKTFTPTGIQLESGKHLDADLVISATGFEIAVLGQVKLTVDGTAINVHHSYVYKGLMFSGLPNLAWCIGYTNASWTLRADLSSQYVCKFINYLDEKGYAFGMPDPVGSSGPSRPAVDLTSGYVLRAVGAMPQQGTASPWTIRQNWLLDSRDMRRTDLAQDMVFGKAAMLSEEVVSRAS